MENQRPSLNYSGGRQVEAEQAARKKVLLLSLLLHLLLFLIWGGALRLGLIGLKNEPQAVPLAPIVLELQDEDLPRRVIETPPDALSRPEDQPADFLSDRNALARNQEDSPPVPPGKDPYAAGDFQTHEAPPRPGLTAADPQSNPDGRAELEDAAARARSELEAATGELKVPVQKEPMQRLQEMPRSPGVAHRELESRVRDSGGLSFNTYDWDFAPYMLELKGRIQNNLFPPMAFSKLGIIDGDTLLRFKIFPDGRLADLQILGYQGHRSLMETSANAVLGSAPFRRLPLDFPKEYLEVTARFSYFVNK